MSGYDCPNTNFYGTARSVTNDVVATYVQVTMKKKSGGGEKEGSRLTYDVGLRGGAFGRKGVNALAWGLVSCAALCAVVGGAGFCILGSLNWRSCLNSRRPAL